MLEPKISPEKKRLFNRVAIALVILATLLFWVAALFSPKIIHH